MDSIDKLLAQLKAEYTEPAAAPPPQPPAPAAPIAPPPTSPPLRKSTAAFDPIDNLLSEVKAGYAEQDVAAELARQEQLQAEQRRQAQLLEQRRAAIAPQAKAWLSKLDPLSTEGLWFEQFSHNYPSKLEAAIDYLLAAETP